MDKNSAFEKVFQKTRLEKKRRQIHLIMYGSLATALFVIMVILCSNEPSADKLFMVSITFILEFSVISASNFALEKKFLKKKKVLLKNLPRKTKC